MNLYTFSQPITHSIWNETLQDFTESVPQTMLQNLPNIISIAIVAFLDNQLSVYQDKSTEDDQAQIQLNLIRMEWINNRMWMYE